MAQVQHFRSPLAKVQENQQHHVFGSPPISLKATPKSSRRSSIGLPSGHQAKRSFKALISRRLDGIEEADFKNMVATYRKQDEEGKSTFKECLISAVSTSEGRRMSLNSMQSNPCASTLQFASMLVQEDRTVAKEVSPSLIAKAIKRAIASSNTVSNGIIAACVDHVKVIVSLGCKESDGDVSAPDTAPAVQQIVLRCLSVVKELKQDSQCASAINMIGPVMEACIDEPIMAKNCCDSTNKVLEALSTEALVRSQTPISRASLLCASQLIAPLFPHIGGVANSLVLAAVDHATSSAPLDRHAAAILLSACAPLFETKGMIGPIASDAAITSIRNLRFDRARPVAKAATDCAVRLGITGASDTAINGTGAACSRASGPGSALKSAPEVSSFLSFKNTSRDISAFILDDLSGMCLPEGDGQFTAAGSSQMILPCTPEAAMPGPSQQAADCQADPAEMCKDTKRESIEDAQALMQISEMHNYTQALVPSSPLPQSMTPMSVFSPPSTGQASSAGKKKGKSSAQKQFSPASSNLRKRAANNASTAAPSSPAMTLRAMEMPSPSHTLPSERRPIDAQQEGFCQRAEQKHVSPVENTSEKEAVQSACSDCYAPPEERQRARHTIMFAAKAAVAAAIGWHAPVVAATLVEIVQGGGEGWAAAAIANMLA